MPSRNAPLHWGRSTVETACPLDCPDSCSIAVSVEEGRIVSIAGGRHNPTTGGFICAKVRNFAARVYGEDRLQFPLVRKGRKGAGSFERVTWDEALQRIVENITHVRKTWGGEAILPVYYGGSNGWVTQDTADAELFRGLGASRQLRTLCAAATGAAAQALYNRMPGVAYEDYPHARLIVVWGANPSASGIHLLPFIKQARARGASLVVVDPRRTPLAKLADLHVVLRPGTDVVVALAVHRYLFEDGHADTAFLEQHTTGWKRLREKAQPWTFERAAAISGAPVEDLRRLATLYAGASPALIRCGWGLERNRNGASAVMAVLALPAVAGKFGVRGGGFTMSNSAAWKVNSSLWLDTPEPATRAVNQNHLGRALLELDGPPLKHVFVYNANPVATFPDQQRVIRGFEREDLFTVVFDQVMTDTARFADVILPATTFLETYDLARGYGSYSLQIAKPVIEPIGESRPNAEVFGELGRRLGIAAAGEYQSDVEALLKVTSRLPEPLAAALSADVLPEPPEGRAPIQFVDVFPRTEDGRIHLHPDDVDRDAPAGAYGYRADPATAAYPLALISPASEKTVSSTLGELRARPASLYMNSEDARERGIEEGDAVRVHNALGEVQCPVIVGEAIARGTVSLPKGLWRRSTFNQFTANALAPDTLTDVGGGACFNDARVEVTRIVPAAFAERDVAVWVATGPRDVPRDVH